MSCNGTRRKVNGRQTHCGSCHRSFGGLRGFDVHRKGGQCNDPAGLNMHEAAGIWRSNDQHPRSRPRYERQG